MTTANNTPPRHGAPTQEEPALPSFYPVTVIMAVLVIMLVTPLIPWYGSGMLLLLLVGLLLWDALSKQSFQAMQRTYPGLSRRWWISHALIHHLLLPSLFFGGLALLVALFRALTG